MNENGYNTFAWIALFAVLAAIVNGLGILILYKYKDRALRSKPYFICCRCPDFHPVDAGFAPGYRKEFLCRVYGTGRFFVYVFLKQSDKKNYQKGSAGIRNSSG